MRLAVGYLACNKYSSKEVAIDVAKLSTKTVDDALDAGADYIVCPGFDECFVF